MSRSIIDPSTWSLLELRGSRNSKHSKEKTRGRSEAMSRVCHEGVIGALPVFSLLTNVELATLLSSLRTRSYPPRAVVLRAGYKPDGFYFILSGCLHVFMDDGAGRRVLMAVLGPSDFFGQAELITGAACSEMFEAHDKCQILCIPKDAFDRTLMQNAHVVALMLRTLVSRLRLVDQKIHDLVFLDVYERVARTLLDTSLSGNGEWLVVPGCEQIAMMVAASREMVSRVLKKMIGSGLIHRRGRRLVVVDRPALERITRCNDVTTQKQGLDRSATAAAPITPSFSLQQLTP